MIPTAFVYIQSLLLVFATLWIWYLQRALETTEGSEKKEPAHAHTQVHKTVEIRPRRGRHRPERINPTVRVMMSAA